MAIVDTLEEFRHVDGPFLQPFSNKTRDSDNYFVPLTVGPQRGERQNQRLQFARDRQNFITELIGNITGRFPQMDLLDAMQVIAIWVYSKIYSILIY